MCSSEGSWRVSGKVSARMETSSDQLLLKSLLASSKETANPVATLLLTLKLIVRRS